MQKFAGLAHSWRSDRYRTLTSQYLDHVYAYMGMSPSFFARVDKSCFIYQNASGIPSSYRVHIWYRKTRMAELQSGKGCMMIDSVIWTQYIKVTETHTDSHVAVAANPAPTHCTERQNVIIFQTTNVLTAYNYDSISVTSK